MLEKILSVIAWPVTAIIVFLIFILAFRTPLTGLLNRFRRVGYGDKIIELSDLAALPADQQKKAEDKRELAPRELPAPPPAALPPAFPIVEPLEKELQNWLEAQQFAPEAKIAWLIRVAALWHLVREHELTYRIIFGSQIALLLQANTASPPDLARARALYEQAKAAFPQFFPTFSFENWIAWPVHRGLISREGDADTATFKITPIGQDFLHYLINNGLTEGKQG